MAAESPALIALARQAANNAGIPEDLFLGLVRTESAWNPAARSSAGALGLAQVMPWWISQAAAAASIGMAGRTPADLQDPEIGLTAGARILAQELKRFGAWELAAMAYNAGAPAVTAAINRAGTRDPAAVSAQLPSAETRAYWQKVGNWANHYAQKAGELATEAENFTAETVEELRDSGSAAPILLVVLAALGLILTVARR